MESYPIKANDKKLDRLREKVKKIEDKIRTIVDKTPYWWSDERHLRDKVDELLCKRWIWLDEMFLATPAEVARFEAINDMLLKKVRLMHARAAMLWETMLKMQQMPDFDDVYEVRGELTVYGDRSDEECVLKLPEDEYYGSDFALANEAIVATLPRNWSHAFCGHFIRPLVPESKENNPEYDFSDSMEDGQSWAEGSLRHRSLSHICICHPIHDLVTHCYFSIPDLLRINTFTTKVWLEISNETTQSGIRSFEKEYRSWWTNEGKLSLS